MTSNLENDRKLVIKEFFRGLKEKAPDIAKSVEPLVQKLEEGEVDETIVRQFEQLLETNDEVYHLYEETLIAMGLGDYKALRFDPYPTNTTPPPDEIIVCCPGDPPCVFIEISDARNIPNCPYCGKQMILAE